MLQVSKNKKTKTYQFLKNTYTCFGCNKTFKTYRNLCNHEIQCDLLKKANVKQDDDIIAHQLWVISFKGTNRKNFDFTTFYSHRDYNFFKKIAEHYISLKLINNGIYIDFFLWCMERKIKASEWVSDALYTDFIKQFQTKENPITAIIRSLEFIITKYDTAAFFADIQPGTFLTMIDMGRISPWFIYVCFEKIQHTVVKKMNSEQLQKFDQILNNSTWTILINRHKTNKELAELKLNIKDTFQ